MPVSFSRFAQGVKVETAFSVLAVAKALIAQGKRVIELEIGDSPFPSTAHAKSAGIAAIEQDRSHYCPSPGIPEFRQAAADCVRRLYGLDVGPEHITAGPGAKYFETLFCEAFLNPGDGVLVFSPHFPTYGPNIERRGARMVLARLRQEDDFRPRLDSVASFLKQDAAPRAIFLNSPHNPTGGIATLEDMQGLADLVRGKNIAVFSDEPYDQMVWQGRHHSFLEVPGMIDQAVSAFTFSKSYSMSGWRIGFAVTSPEISTILARLINTTISCVPPLVQLAAAAALNNDSAERDRDMQEFHAKVIRLAKRLNQVPGVQCLEPAGTFYAFPRVVDLCNRLKITSHGLAMFLLEGADDSLGLACLGGECFGAAGGGFLRLSCAEPDDRLMEAVQFLEQAVTRTDRLERYLEGHPQFRLESDYA